MKKRGVRLEYDENGSLSAIKEKGKLTLDDICDAIMNAWDFGHYVIILNCNETVRDCAGWNDDREPEGDACTLYPIKVGNPSGFQVCPKDRPPWSNQRFEQGAAEYEKCPVCAQVTPLLEHCPECGHKLPQRTATRGTNRD